MNTITKRWAQGVGINHSIEGDPICLSGLSKNEKVSIASKNDLAEDNSPIKNHFIIRTVMVIVRNPKNIDPPDF